MSEPIKICFVSLQARGAFLPGTGKVGGAETQVRLWAEYLAAQPDFDVHVIVEDSGQPALERACGATLHRLTQPPVAPGRVARVRRLGGSALGLWRLARGLGAQVYLQRCAGAETGIIEHAAHTIGARFLYMMASDSECDPPWSAGGGVSGWLFRRGLSRADAITAQHTPQATRIGEVFAHAADVLPNVFDFTAAAGGATAAGPVEFAPDAARRSALWVGRASRIKAPHLYVELAARLPEFHFTLIAPAAENEMDYWAELQAALPRASNLTFIAGVASDALAPHYAHAGVLVNTSDFEGMPNTFLEAAAQGLALVSLNADAGGLLREPTRAGLCMDGDFEKLVAMTRGLLTDDAGRARWATRARAALAERHDLAHIGPQFVTLLRALAAGAHPTPVAGGGTA